MNLIVPAYGRLIAARRKLIGMTQAELGSAIGKDQARISQIENGKHLPYNALGIARYLQIPEFEARHAIARSFGRVWTGKELITATNVDVLAIGVTQAIINEAPLKRPKMKRTPFKRKTPLQAKPKPKRAPQEAKQAEKKQKRKTPFMSTKSNLRPVSPRQAKINRQRTILKRELFAIRGYACQARTHLCTGRARDMHEVLTRGRCGSATDADNIILVCGECHRWITDHPREAKELGLLKSAES